MLLASMPIIVDLKLAGWRVIRIWECEIRTKAKREETLKNLYCRIINLQNTEIYHTNEIDNTSIAAEPEFDYST